jgi:hypothetical protein
MSTVLDQAHNAIDRKLFAMKGFHHPGGSQGAFLMGLAHLYNLIPYQRRALHTGKCGVEVEGGRVPTSDWRLRSPRRPLGLDDGPGQSLVRPREGLHQERSLAILSH